MTENIEDNICRALHPDSHLIWNPWHMSPETGVPGVPQEGLLCLPKEKKL